jgi:hypothetical protein
MYFVGCKIWRTCCMTANIWEAALPDTCSAWLFLPDIWVALASIYLGFSIWQFCGRSTLRLLYLAFFDALLPEIFWGCSTWHLLRMFYQAFVEDALPGICWRCLIWHLYIEPVLHYTWHLFKKRGYFTGNLLRFLYLTSAETTLPVHCLEAEF